MNRGFWDYEKEFRQSLLNAANKMPRDVWDDLWSKFFQMITEAGFQKDLDPALPAGGRDPTLEQELNAIRHHLRDAGLLPSLRTDGSFVNPATLVMRLWEQRDEARAELAALRGAPAGAAGEPCHATPVSREINGFAVAADNDRNTIGLCRLLAEWRYGPADAAMRMDSEFELAKYLSTKGVTVGPTTEDTP